MLPRRPSWIHAGRWSQVRTAKGPQGCPASRLLHGSKRVHCRRPPGQSTDIGRAMERKELDDSANPEPASRRRLVRRFVLLSPEACVAVGYSYKQGHKPRLGAGRALERKEMGDQKFSNPVVWEQSCSGSPAAPMLTARPKSPELRRFRYQRLQGPGRIRLLEIPARGGGSAPPGLLECRIREVALADAPPYRALSYTWRGDGHTDTLARAVAEGWYNARTPDGDASRLILCDGGRMFVTQNLHNAPQCPIEPSPGPLVDRPDLHVFLSNCNETPRKLEVYASVFRGI